jgi:hypothetical protein
MHVRPGGQLPTHTGATPPHGRRVVLVVVVVGAEVEVVDVEEVDEVLDVVVVVVIGAHAHGAANPAPVHSSPGGQLPRHTG